MEEETEIEGKDLIKTETKVMAGVNVVDPVMVCLHELWVHYPLEEDKGMIGMDQGTTGRRTREETKAGLLKIMKLGTKLQ